MLIPLEHTSVPPPGYQRADVGRWQAETQIAFTHLTLYAPGWSLHGLAVGGALLMFPWEIGARLSPAAPLTFKVHASAGARIDVELAAPSDVQSPAAPYVVLRRSLYKPAPFPGAKRKPRGVRLIFDE